jgi:hypothetical protein
LYSSQQPEVAIFAAFVSILATASCGANANLKVWLASGQQAEYAY